MNKRIIITISIIIITILILTILLLLNNYIKISVDKKTILLYNKYDNLILV